MLKISKSGLPVESKDIITRAPVRAKKRVTYTHAPKNLPFRCLHLDQTRTSQCFTPSLKLPDSCSVTPYPSCNSNEALFLFLNFDYKKCIKISNQLFHPFRYFQFAKTGYDIVCNYLQAGAQRRPNEISAMKLKHSLEPGNPQH